MESALGTVGAAGRKHAEAVADGGGVNVEEINFTPFVQLEPSLWCESATILGGWIYAPGKITTMPERENAKLLIRKFGNRFTLYMRGPIDYFGLTFNDCLYFCRPYVAWNRVCLWRITWNRIECIGPEQIRILRPEEWYDAEC